MDYIICTTCTWTSSLFASVTVPSDIRAEAMEHIITGDCAGRILDLRRGHIDVPAAHIEDHVPARVLERAC